MKDYLLSTVEAGKYFSDPLYLDQKYILLSPDAPVDSNLLERLKRWNYSYLYSEGEIRDKPTGSSAIPGGSSGGDENGGSASATLDADVKESSLFAEANAAFLDMVEFTEKLFTDFVTRGELPVKLVSSKVKNLIEVVRSHKQYILRINELKVPEKNFIVLHSVKTAIVGSALGMSLKLPNHKMIELASTCLLHEIGMIKLPPQLYMTDKILTQQERKAISAHTLLGFKILKAQSYPVDVCLGVLESHENIDGSGYPRGLPGDKISLYAKVVSVCGSYAALTSDRPFRHSIDGYNTVLELLKNRGKRYDEVVLRSFIATVSIFPIGTYVKIVNGSNGMVVQTNNDNPKAPYVKLLTGPNGERYTEHPIVDTSKSGYQITRPLTAKEKQDLEQKQTA